MIILLFKLEQKKRDASSSFTSRSINSIHSEPFAFIAAKRMIPSNLSVVVVLKINKFTILQRHPSIHPSRSICTFRFSWTNRECCWLCYVFLLPGLRSHLSANALLRNAISKVVGYAVQQSARQQREQRSTINAMCEYVCTACIRDDAVDWITITCRNSLCESLLLTSPYLRMLLGW